MDDSTDQYLGLAVGGMIILCMFVIIASIVREYYQDLNSYQETLLNDSEIV